MVYKSTDAVRRLLKRREDANQCLRCGVDGPHLYDRKKCDICSKRDNKRGKKYRDKLKRRVIDEYGGKCNCCGEKEIEFLSIDHVNGDGKQDRDNGNQGSTLFNLIVKENFPDRYRVLCMNCNMSSHFGDGICIHQR